MRSGALSESESDAEELERLVSFRMCAPTSPSRPPAAIASVSQPQSQSLAPLSHSRPGVTSSSSPLRSAPSLVAQALSLSARERAAALVKLMRELSVAALQEQAIVAEAADDSSGIEAASTGTAPATAAAAAAPAVFIAGVLSSEEAARAQLPSAEEASMKTRMVAAATADVPHTRQQPPPPQAHDLCEPLRSPVAAARKPRSLHDALGVVSTPSAPLVAPHVPPAFLSPLSTSASSLHSTSSSPLDLSSPLARNPNGLDYNRHRYSEVKRDSNHSDTESDNSIDSDSDSDSGGMQL